MPDQNEKISLIKFILTRPEGQRLAAAAMIALMFMAGLYINETVSHRKDNRYFEKMLDTCNEKRVEDVAAVSKRLLDYAIGVDVSTEKMRRNVDSISDNSKQMKKTILKLKRSK